jgi:hypothetical protein
LSSTPRTRYLGYGGLGCLLLAVVLFMVATTESRYEHMVHRTKGIVLAKDIRTRDRSPYPAHVVTYRVVIAGKTLEREGDVPSRKVWDSIPVGGEVDVEAVGDTVYEIRLATERVASSTVYRILSAASAVGGIVLLVFRMRK